MMFFSFFFLCWSFQNAESMEKADNKHANREPSFYGYYGGLSITTYSITAEFSALAAHAMEILAHNHITTHVVRRCPS